MPCENCQCQFSVFKRKRSCSDCKRFYCNNCLSLSKLCERCAVFAKRPLRRADLLQLKPKDLIFYLQSKHISTAGCVEKDELIGLVLHYAQETENLPHNSNENAGESRTHFDSDVPRSFSNLKQTCQNFFTNITENINDSFSSFDSKQTSNSHAGSQQRAGSGQAFYSPSHIFDQPRISTREIPTYASYQNSSATHSQQPVPSFPNSDTGRVNGTSRDVEYQHSSKRLPPRSGSTNINTLQNNHDSSPTANSPVVSVSSITSQPPGSSEDYHDNSLTTAHTVSMSSEDNKFDSKSDCECFDEEFIAAFNERVTIKIVEDVNEDTHSVEPTTSAAASAAAAAATTTITMSSTLGKVDSLSANVNVINEEEEGSSQSSFEELGAIGGISDDSKGTTDTSSSNMEQWQILDAQRDGVTSATTTVAINDDGNECNQNKSEILQLPQQKQSTITNITTAIQRPKKVIRRRSDGYLNHRLRPFSDEDSPTSTGLLQQLTLFEQDENESLVREQSIEPKRQRASCSRCGKNRKNLKQHVAKMRRHLESAQMPEADIKQELNVFLSYLEKRTNSIDCSDSEQSPVSPAVTHGMQTESSLNFADDAFNAFVENEDDGIHVYASSSDYSFGETRRFINLDHFESLDELEFLTVKQLKEVLMLNRVDYKGCCEKKELLERVERLWKNLKSTPGVDRLQTDELCKICMDAPIECVILECGHCCTCTNCGKVLSECPICRQYIVRVVRFFKA